MEKFECYGLDSSFKVSVLAMKNDTFKRRLVHEGKAMKSTTHSSMMWLLVKLQVSCILQISFKKSI